MRRRLSPTDSLGSGYGYTTDWKIGDFVITYMGAGIKIGRIIGEKINGHTLCPEYEFLENALQLTEFATRSDKRYEPILITDILKKILKEWLDKSL